MSGQHGDAARDVEAADPQTLDAGGAELAREVDRARGNWFDLDADDDRPARARRGLSCRG